MKITAQQLLKGPAGIVANVGKPHAARAVRRIIAALDRQGVPWLLETQTAACCKAHEAGTPMATLIGQVKWLVVIGGDGTILHAARTISPRTLPILGVNPGESLGFMTDTRMEDFAQTLRDIAEGGFSIVERATLATLRQIDDARATSLPPALNDVVFTHAGQARLIALEVLLNGAYFTTYSADGLIVATATGSTAHSLSAGGPVLFPSTEALVMTPICPHTLSNRPVILPRGYTVEVRIGTPCREVHVSLDGQPAQPMRVDERIIIQLGPAKLRFIHSARQTFPHVLREKLHWRGDLKPARQAEREGAWPR